MIFVDPQGAKKDSKSPWPETLMTELPKLGVECELLMQPFGDANFVGRGLNGSPVTVGIELKTFDDFMNRFQDFGFVAHQLPGLVREFDHSWLLIEGMWRYGPDGGLEVRKGKDWVQFGYSYSGLHNWKGHDIEAHLLTLIYRTGIKIKLSPTRSQTIHWLSTLYRWWTHKDFDQHKSHLNFHIPPPDRAFLIKPNLVRRMAKELDGVNWERSIPIAQRFEYPLDMCLANEREWRGIPGIGKVLAERIVLALRGRR